MINDHGQRVCNRCGVLITAYCPSVETLAIIGVFHENGDQAVVDEIVRRENIDPDVIWEYFRHRMAPQSRRRVSRVFGELQISWRNYPMKAPIG